MQDTGITQGGGFPVGQRFSSTPVGTTTISDNTLIRNGSLDPNWQFGVGSLWFDGSQGAIDGPVNGTDALIQQSPYEAIQWVEGTVSGVNLNNVTIAGTGAFALEEQTGGSGSFTDVTATGVNGPAPVYGCEGGNFTVTDGGGNSGIGGTAYCGGWPTPVYPPHPASTVTVSPSALNFGSQAGGTTSAAQTVTVSNPTGSSAPVSSITTSGDFAQTDTCGGAIAANGSCTVSVTFTPTATGTRTGTLTVGAGGTTNTVSLTGTGAAAGPVLSAGPANLSFPGTVVGSSAGAKTVTQTYASSNVTDGNQSTYWESANNTFPQWVQVDLGSQQSADRVVLQLPAGWGSRHQTLSLLGSTDGTAFSTVKASATYTFDPATGNTVTITFPATAQRTRGAAESRGLGGTAMPSAGPSAGEVRSSRPGTPRSVRPATPCSP